MLFLSGIFVYPMTKLAFSISGANDFLSAADHLLHGRIKKTTISMIKGGFKLGMTVGATYIVAKAVFDKFKRN